MKAKLSIASHEGNALIALVLVSEIIYEAMHSGNHRKTMASFVQVRQKDRMKFGTQPKLGGARHIRCANFARQINLKEWS